MKKSIILKSLEVLQKRIETVKKTSENDPYVDAYALSTKLIQELISILKTTSVHLTDMQLQHWIERQEYVGKETEIKSQIHEDINVLDSILNDEEKTEQMSIYDLPEIKDENPYE